MLLGIFLTTIYFRKKNFFHPQIFQLSEVDFGRLLYVILRIM